MSYENLDPPNLFPLSLWGKAGIERKEKAKVHVSSPSRVDFKTPEAESLFNNLRNADTSISEYQNSETLIELLGLLYDKWVTPFQSGDVEFRVVSHSLLNLSLTGEHTSMTIWKAYVSAIFETMRLYLLFVVNDFISDDNDITLTNKLKFQHIMAVATHVYESVSSEQRIMCVSKGILDVAPGEVKLFRFSFPDYALNNEYQNLVLYLLYLCLKRGYRKFEGSCYEQIYSGAYPTHSWKEVCSIRDFVYSAIIKELCYEQWKNMTHSRDNISQAARYLTECRDVEFPTLEFDRHYISFKNGVFLTSDCSFHSYRGNTLSHTVVSANFIDMDFDADDYCKQDYWKLPTPEFESILDHQEFGQDVKYWMYVFLGRLMFAVNEKDQWQVMPFFLGRAGTGKSLLAKIVSLFFHARFIGILSTNSEKKFGISALIGKMIWVCYEVRNNFGLDQSEFQSMVSGESMSLARKYLGPLHMLFGVPGLACGNEVFGYCDTGQSVARRTVCFLFSKFVNEKDPGLFEKVKLECPKILFKAICAYLDAAETFRSKDIWSVLPQYFQDTRVHMSTNVNSLIGFLTCGDVVVIKEEYKMPWNEFCVAYYEWVKNNGLKKVQMKEDQYSPIFAQLGLKKETLEVDVRGQVVGGTFAVGVGLRGSGETVSPSRGAAPLGSRVSPAPKGSSGSSGSSSSSSSSALAEFVSQNTSASSRAPCFNFGS